jgi:hypothetical protein
MTDLTIRNRPDPKVLAAADAAGHGDWLRRALAEVRRAAAGDDKPAERKYACPACGDAFPTKGGLAQHLPYCDVDAA